MLALVTRSADARSAELVMFRRDGCPWCLVWDREIGPIYAKSEAGQRAPLRVINLEGPQPQNISLRFPVRYTPTFVLVAENREIARIEGYPGEDFFWGLLERFLEQLPSRGQGDLSAGHRREM